MLLEEVLGTRNQIRALRALFRQGESTVTQVAREAGIQPSAALFALRKLVDTGIVRARRCQRNVLYSIDENHFLASYVENLLAVEDGLGPHTANLVVSLLGEDGSENLRGLCLTPNGRVYVCHKAPHALPRERLDHVLRSMFGLRLADVVPDRRRVHEPHAFVPVRFAPGKRTRPPTTEGSSDAS